MPIQPLSSIRTPMQSQPSAKVKVLEVDQWVSTGNIQDFTLENFDFKKVKGGDSAAAFALFGRSNIKIREVNENEQPFIGNVWFKPGVDGKLQRWKANYDSSD